MHELPDKQGHPNDPSSAHQNRGVANLAAREASPTAIRDLSVSLRQSSQGAQPRPSQPEAMPRFQQPLAASVHSYLLDLEASPWLQ